MTPKTVLLLLVNNLFRQRGVWGSPPNRISLFQQSRYIPASRRQLLVWWRKTHIKSCVNGNTKSRCAAGKTRARWKVLWRTLSAFTVYDLPNFMPPVLSFLIYLVAINECDSWAMTSWIYPSRFSPAGSFFRSHSNFFPLALLFLLFPLFSKKLIISPLFFHLLAGRPEFPISIADFCQPNFLLWFGTRSEG